MAPHATCTDIGTRDRFRAALAASQRTTPVGNGHADTVALIRAGITPPVVLDHVGVGDMADTLAISPDERYAVIAVVKGSAAPQASPASTRDSAAVLIAILPEGRLRFLGEAPAGAVVQGIAFDPSGNSVYIGNDIDRSLGVYRIAGDMIQETGFRLPLPGQPASSRGRP